MRPSPPETERSPEEIVRLAGDGAHLLTLRGLGMRLISVLSNLALFAIVSPADLGLYAVIRGLAGLTGTTTDLGFAWALLRREREPSREEFGAFVGLQLSLILVLLGLVLIKPSLVSLVGAIPENRQWWMLAVLLTTITIPFGNTAKIRIERRLDYRRIAIFDLTSVLLQNVALLVCALTGYFTAGAFLVVGGTILYNNLLLWYWSPGPGPLLRLAAWRRLLREFAGFSAGHACSILYSNGTPVLLANLFGLQVTGLWSFAARLGNTLQMAFEGFRRAAVPAAALITGSEESLRRLATLSLRGAARFTVPAMAGLLVGLPVIASVWRQWEPAVLVGQLYVLGYGISGLIAASLIPVMVAMQGPRAVIAEQAVPMAIAWMGFLLLDLAGSTELAAVVLPMHLGLATTLWMMSRPGVRPRWEAAYTWHAVSLLSVLVVGALGLVLQAPVVLVAGIGGAVFLLVRALMAWGPATRIVSGANAGAE